MFFYHHPSIREVYTNFALSIALMLLIDGDNAPLYRGLIESGLGLDWASPVVGMDRNIRTTCFHVGLQGVKPEELDKIDEAILKIIKKAVETGFPQVRYSSISNHALHKLKFDVYHEARQSSQLFSPDRFRCFW